VTAPAIDPVALADVKTFLRISGTADDAMLTAFISAATRIIERYTSRRLITQTWDYFADRFPSDNKFDSMNFEGTIEGKLSEFISTKKFIAIPLFPLQSVTYLKTYDDANVAYTMTSTEYFVDVKSEPGRLALTNNSTWPTTFLRPVQGIEIRFVCGYGALATDVPYELRHAIMQTVGVFYTNRGCAENEDAIPKSALALIQAYRVFRL